MLRNVLAALIFLIDLFVLAAIWRGRDSLGRALAWSAFVVFIPLGGALAWLHKRR